MNKRASLNNLADGISKNAGVIDQNLLKYLAIYGAPTLTGAAIGALVDKKKRLRGGILGALLGLGTGGLVHGGLSLYDKYKEKEDVRKVLDRDRARKAVQKLLVRSFSFGTTNTDADEYERKPGEDDSSYYERLEKVPESYTIGVVPMSDSSSKKDQKKDSVETSNDPEGTARRKSVLEYTRWDKSPLEYGQDRESPLEPPKGRRSILEPEYKRGGLFDAPERKSPFEIGDDKKSFLEI